MSDKERLSFGTKHPDAVFRKSVVAVIFNVKKDKILVLDWPIFDCPGFVTGGLEDGENEEDALRREVIEETGYLDFEIVNKLGEPVDSYYYADNKNVWRHAEMHPYLIVLNSDKKQDQTLEENEKFTPRWSTVEDFLEKVDQAPIDDRNDFRPLRVFVERALN